MIEPTETSRLRVIRMTACAAATIIRIAALERIALKFSGVRELRPQEREARAEKEQESQHAAYPEAQRELSEGSLRYFNRQRANVSGHRQDPARFAWQPS